MELFEMRQITAKSQAKLESLGTSLDLEGKRRIVQENEEIMAGADFWNDQKNFDRRIKEI